MSQNGKTKMDSLTATIRRQVGAERNQRYFRALPQFRLDDEMPDELGRLLTELDRAEARARPADNSR
ncbi:MAG: hypothetical protein KF723_09420 [Rhizobiaceae bacterium]|nr:hypothetical protein [Rhizobiaceae bacterium]